MTRLNAAKLTFKALIVGLAVFLTAVGPVTTLVADARESTATKEDLIPNAPPLWVWKADGTPKAVVLTLHELGLHAGAFENFGARSAKKGITVYSMDLRGFGAWRQKDPKQKMDHDDILSDVKAALEGLHKEYPNTPVFLLGEAMGGATALRAAKEFPTLTQGIISSAPGGAHFKTLTNYLTVCHRMFKGPNKRFDYGKELVAMGTPKTSLREAYEKDPLVRLDLTPKELMDCQFLMYKTKGMARKIKTQPVLIVQGEQDKMTKPSSAESIAEKLKTKDKKLMMVSNGDHYVFEDVQVDDKVMNDTLGWIDEHVKAQ